MNTADKIQQIKLEKMNKNEEEGAAFIAAYALKEGAVIMPEGIVYTVIKAGDGENFPTINSVVNCHYHGTLTNGTIFDSSVQRGAPISFPLKQVIEGWQIAIPKMSLGSKHEIVIPANLAYGDRNAGSISAGSTLIFEVELLGIK
jgi:FKBP-type peptidyl-prolyl cis-trans isomerase FklB